MVSARSRTSAPTSAFTHEHKLNGIFLNPTSAESSQMHVFGLTLASHGHCDIDI